MKLSVTVLLAWSLGFLGLVNAQYPNPISVSGDIGVHDPTIVKVGSTYFLYATAPGISIKTSTDRKNWRAVGTVWPRGKATWTDTYALPSAADGPGNANLWAPDVSYNNGKFYLYYSASSFGSSRSAIFLATSTTGLAGSWTHQGLVVESNANSNYNAIDAHLLVDANGAWTMSFGSFWSGIKQIQINPATGLRSGSSLISLASRSTNGRAIEAPTTFKYGNYYYLFVSFDLCCKGAQSTYRIMVGRSTSPSGPFVDKAGVQMNNGGGTQVLAGHGQIFGPGHQDVFQDTDGVILVYHWYGSNGFASLGMNYLTWTDGWPSVSSTPGTSPTTTTRPPTVTTTTRPPTVTTTTKPPRRDHH